MSHDYALAGVAQWIERPPADQSVAGMILGHGIWPGVGQVPSWGCMGGNQSKFLPFLSASFLLSLKINKYNL